MLGRSNLTPIFSASKHSPAAAQKIRHGGNRKIVSASTARWRIFIQLIVPRDFISLDIYLASGKIEWS